MYILPPSRVYTFICVYICYSSPVCDIPRPIGSIYTRKNLKPEHDWIQAKSSDASLNESQKLDKYPP